MLNEKETNTKSVYEKKLIHKIPNINSEYSDDDDENSSQHAAKFSAEKGRQYMKSIHKKEYAQSFRDKAHKKSKMFEEREKAREKISELFKKNSEKALIAASFLMLLLLLLSVMGSGAILLEGASSIVSMTTYPSDDEEMKKAEEYYCYLENNLEKKIKNIKSTNPGDEYRISADETGHNPYELISFLTAIKGESWTKDEMKSYMDMAFSKQYLFTVSNIRQVRYRTETRKVWYEKEDKDGNVFLESKMVTDYVPYEYVIVSVKLVNNGFDSAALKLMNNSQKEKYEVLNETKGNREDLFA